MHVRVQISKELVISIMVFIAGIICLAAGFSGMYRRNRIVDISEINPDNCIKGRYVAGYIDRYLVRQLEYGGYEGVSVESVDPMNPFQVYTVPAGEGSYIRILANKKDTLENLESFAKGRGEGVYFVGKIKEFPMINPQWYGSVEELKGSGMQRIIKDYAVMQANSKDQNIKIVMGGFVLLFISLIIFKSMGGKRGVVSRTEEDINSIITSGEDLSEAVILEYSLNKEFNLMEERRKLDGLYDKIVEMRTGCVYAYIGLILSMIIFIADRHMDLRLIMLAAMGFCIFVIMKYHLNSGKDYTDRIMMMFERESVAMKIRRSTAFIEKLEKAIAEGKENDHKKSSMTNTARHDDTAT